MSVLRGTDSADEPSPPVLLYSCICTEFLIKDWKNIKRVISPRRRTRNRIHVRRESCDRHSESTSYRRPSARIVNTSVHTHNNFWRPNAGPGQDKRNNRRIQPTGHAVPGVIRTEERQLDLRDRAADRRIRDVPCSRRDGVRVEGVAPRNPETRSR